jgi:hypothetical protein
MEVLQERDHLTYVVDRLSVEYGDRIDPETIRRVATEEVALFDGASVQDFIPILALRLARTRLADAAEPSEDRQVSV